jgi:hypothetical protein
MGVSVKPVRSRPAWLTYAPLSEVGKRVQDYKALNKKEPKGREFTSPSPHGTVLGSVVCLPELIEYIEYLVQEAHNLIQWTIAAEQAGKCAEEVPQ